MTRPGAVSDAAKAWLAAGGDGFTPDQDADLKDIRAAREAYYGQSAAQVIADAGLTSKNITLGGIRCQKIAPQHARDDQAIFYAHGGGFMFGSPDQDMAIIAGLAVGTGCAVIAPNYRLAPEYPFPSGQDDCAAALVAALDTYSSVALVGCSAGATMVMTAAARNLPQARAAVRCIALISPCSDLGDLGDSAKTNRDPVMDPTAVSQVHTIYAPGQDLRNPEISILFGSYDADFPPTLITTGTRDLLLSSCVRLDQVMRGAQAPVSLRVYEGMWHAFEFYGDALPEAQRSLSDISTFIAQHLDTTQGG